MPLIKVPLLKNIKDTFQKLNDDLAKKVANLIVEKDFLERKLVSFTSSKESKTLVMLSLICH